MQGAEEAPVRGGDPGGGGVGGSGVGGGGAAESVALNEPDTLNSLVWLQGSPLIVFGIQRPGNAASKGSSRKVLRSGTELQIP